MPAKAAPTALDAILDTVGRRDFGDLGKIFVAQLVFPHDEFATKIVQRAVKAELRPAQRLLDAVCLNGRLGEKSGISLPTIQRLEAKNGELGGRYETREKIRAALERARIEFTNCEEPACGAGRRGGRGN